MIMFVGCLVAQIGLQWRLIRHSHHHLNCENISQMTGWRLDEDKCVASHATTPSICYTWFIWGLHWRRINRILRRWIEQLLWTPGCLRLCLTRVINTIMVCIMTVFDHLTLSPCICQFMSLWGTVAGGHPKPFWRIQLNILKSFDEWNNRDQKPPSYTHVHKSMRARAGEKTNS